MSRMTAFAAPALFRLTNSSASVHRCPRVKYSHPIRTAAVMSEGAVKAPPAAFAPTIFDKILAKEIPADIVYEDDDVLAFRDINPQAPVHILLIPKRRISMLSTAKESDKELLGTLMLKVDEVAKKDEELKDGYRVLINNGPNGLQSVYHIHLHIVGGKVLNWGPF